VPSTPPAASTEKPDGAIAVYQARAAISRGNAAEASKILEQANELSRDDKQLLCLLAGLYDATGDKMRAGSFAERCKAAGGTPEQVSLPANPTADLPSQPPAAAPTDPTLPEDPAPATTIRRRVRPATGDGP
jgi:hypothetical protein